ncbi:MAG: ATP-binding protein [Actinomycetota bacterium]|nr:ATP-binding protein [Actinomycetota bacterium]
MKRGKRVRRFLSSLRFKLLIIVVIVILPIFGLVLYAAFEQRRDDDEDAREIAVRMAMVAQTEQENLFDDAYRLLLALSQLPELEEGDYAAVTTYFMRVNEGSPRYHNLGVIDANGDTLVSALPEGEGLHLSDRLFYQRAMETREFSTGDFQLSRVSETPILVFAYPVLDEAGEVKMIVLTSLSLEWLSEFMTGADLPPDSVLLVVDGNGVVLAYYPDPQDFIGKRFLETPLVETILGQAEGGTVSVKGLDGVRRTYTYFPLFSTGEGGVAYMGVGFSESEIFSEANRELIRNLVLLGSITLLLLALAWVLGDVFIIRRSKALIEMAERLGEGDLGARSGLPYDYGELGRLALSFDDMAQSLEERVRERRKVEGELRESRAMIEHILDATPNIIYVYDLEEGRSVYISRNVYEQLGYTPQQVEDMGNLIVARLVHPDDQEMMVGFFEKCRDLGDDEIIDLEYRHVTENGKIRLFYSRTTVFSRDEEGRVLQVLSDVQDITERKEAEDEVRRLNIELERRVVERTAQLEDAIRELEAFSYSVSHDLRAPLRAMEGFSSALLEDYSDSLDEQGRDYFNRVGEASRKMSRLIDDILELSRVAKFEMRLEEVDLSGLTAEITGELEGGAPGRSVEFDIQPGLTSLGDPRLLRIALENLLNNAFKFTRGVPEAAIEFSAEVRGEERIYYIRDNGVGFDMDYADKLFHAFQRLHTEEEFPGVGVGLATVQRIIRRHGGEIWAESEVGRGATFYFTLSSGRAS